MHISSCEILFTFTGSKKVNHVVAAAEPSMFGKGRENVFDIDVRDGKELKNGVHIRVAHPELLMHLINDKIEAKVREALFPYAASLEFQFNKVAIYEEGEHFQAHRYTIYAPNHKGTLLIALPSLHCGGDLVLTPLTGSKFTWKSSIFEGISRQSSALPWCAFYTDIVHEVKPVEGGVRMVLQFDIYCEMPLQHSSSSANANTNDSDVEDDKGDEEERKCSKFFIKTNFIILHML